MPHPASRVLAVLELLQSRSRISGPELAQRINVDVRTLRRYIVLLEELGIPITTDSVEKRVSGNALTGCVRAANADQVLNDSGRMRP